MGRPKIRILSGQTKRIEAEVNELLTEYAPISWFFAYHGDVPLVTVLLVHEAELRKGQLANLQMPGVKLQ